jgi:putative hydrolase of the HAD superfamily
VEPLFQNLKEFKNGNAFDGVIIGVISNSDDRVPAVLKSLGLSVGNVRADQGRSSMELPGFEERDAASSQQDQSKDNDIDMIITSYEAGEEKPHKLIFDVATRQAKRFAMNSGTTTASEIEAENVHWTQIHVGDDLEKDYQGAINAGWQSFMVTRDGEKLPSDVKSINSLEELIPEMERYAAR